jgi:serine/threonine-protein kinase
VNADPAAKEGEAEREPESFEAQGSRPTRQVRKPVPSVYPTAQSGASSASEPGLDLSREALMSDELSRVRVTVTVLASMVALGAAFTPFMGGDPFAIRVFRAGLLWALITMAFMFYMASDRSRYDVRLLGAASLSLSIAGSCFVYYLGIYSPAPMLCALGLYVFALTSGQHWAIAAYLSLAGTHGILASLIIYHFIPDRGLVRPTGLALMDETAIQSSVLAIYTIALLAGRASRGKLVGVFNELEASARRLAQRDALLNEAKRELERAAWVGGEGRFTEQVIGAFRLGNVIGRGGMGEVYEAKHIETGQEAAVKLLQRNVFADPSAIKRFAREARAAASLDSPYVVRVLATPADDSPIPYLAMERLRGEDLASMLRRERRLSSRDVGRLVVQVGRALDCARAAGVVHRDLKPQNIFHTRVDDGSQWKVLDFGVSKLVGQATLSRDQLIGTPEYMSPEQASGGAVDHRADLYGLAAVLYRCLVSRPPFVDESLPALIHKVIHEMPPRPGALGRISSDVEAVLAIGLAKEPALRFDSGAALADAFAMAQRLELPPELRERAAEVTRLHPWID